MRRFADALNHLVTPAIGNTHRGWRQTLSVVRQFGGVSWRYWYRLVAIETITRLCSIFQTFEQKKLREQIAQTELHPEPVFILGHWRSGTTHLHNLLSLDTQFGYVTTVQTVFPHAYVTNALLPKLAQWLMPPTRPFDSMRIDRNSPQEEEMALLNYGSAAFYNFWFTPERIVDWYHKTIAFPEGSQEEKHWLNSYVALLSKTSAVSNAKRLLLKNPSNTGRIPALLKQFPRAKFIFIHRNPYSVYPSTQKLHRKVIPMFSLQQYDFKIVSKGIREVYRHLMLRYIQSRDLIPQENLIEVGFQELLDEPKKVLQQIYTQLALGEVEKMRSTWSEYLSVREKHSPIQYDLSDSEIAQISNEWSFSFEEWGYEKCETDLEKAGAD